jgi:hypothetical protein
MAESVSFLLFRLFFGLPKLQETDACFKLRPQHLNDINFLTLHSSLSRAAKPLSRPFAVNLSNPAFPRPFSLPLHPLGLFKSFSTTKGTKNTNLQYRLIFRVFRAFRGQIPPLFRTDSTFFSPRNTRRRSSSYGGQARNECEETSLSNHS